MAGKIYGAKLVDPKLSGRDLHSERAKPDSIQSNYRKGSDDLYARCGKRKVGQHMRSLAVPTWLHLQRGRSNARPGVVMQVWT
jgi:hypothetical protein